MKRKLLAIALTCCIAVPNNMLLVYADEISGSGDLGYNDHLQFDHMRETDNVNTWIFSDESEYTVNVTIDAELNIYENLTYEWSIVSRELDDEDGSSAHEYSFGYTTSDQSICIDGETFYNYIVSDECTLRAEVIVKSDSGDTVAQGGFGFRVEEPQYELYTIESVELLPDEEYEVSNELGAYIKNKDYPDGENVILTVTDVTVENMFGESDPICEVESSENEWVIRGLIDGCAKATVYYDDEKNQSCSYEFYVTVAQDNVEYSLNFENLTGNGWTKVFTDENHPVNLKSDIFYDYDLDALTVEWKFYACEDDQKTEIDVECETYNEGLSILLNGESFANITVPHDDGFCVEATIEHDGELVLQNSFGVVLEYSEMDLGYDFSDVYQIMYRSYWVPRTFSGYTKNADHPYGADVSYTVIGISSDHPEAFKTDEKENGTMIGANTIGDMSITVEYVYEYMDKRADTSDNASEEDEGNGDSSGDEGDSGESNEGGSGDVGESDGIIYTGSVTFTLHTLQDVLQLEGQYPNDNNSMLLNSKMTISTRLGHDYCTDNEHYEDREEKNYVLEIASDDENHVFYDTSALSVEIGEDGKTIIVTSLDKEGYYDIPLSVTCTVNAGTDEEYKVQQINVVGVYVKERYGLIFAEGFNSNMLIGDTDDITLKVYEFYKDENGNEVKSQITDDLTFLIYYDEDCVKFTYANGDPVWNGFTNVDITASELKLTRLIGEGTDISIRAGHQSDPWTFETLYEITLHTENKYYNFNFNNLRDEDSTWIFTNEVMTVGIDTNYADHGITEGVTWEVEAYQVGETTATITTGIEIDENGTLTIDGNALSSIIDYTNDEYCEINVCSLRNDVVINRKSLNLYIKVCDHSNKTENGYCTSCHTVDGDIKALGFNLLLDGKVGVKTEFVASNSVKSVSINGEEYALTKPNEEGICSCIYYLPAKDLNKDITVTYGNETIVTVTAEQLANIYANSSDDDVKAVAESLLDYSKACDNYFNESENTIAHTEQSDVLKALEDVQIPDITSNVDDFEYYGSSLLCKDSLIVRSYFKYTGLKTDKDAIKSLFADATGVKSNADGTIFYVYVDTSFTMAHLDENNAYGYSALCYIKKVVEHADENEKLADLCCALYDCYTASKKLIG